MRPRFFAPALLLSALCAIIPAEDARACGGCFIQPQQQESTVVTGHRMVLSVSPAQSVLWDQIKYTGDPKEFAWVLPVRAGAVIETSTDAWFETLDAATTTTIVAPLQNCGSSFAGCGSAAPSEAGGDLAHDEAGGGVTVLHEGTVGPYETVTLAANEPGVLNKWLIDHGYNVDTETQPVIDAYVGEGFDFIALRLQPGQGVRQMKPVRVLTEGASAELPLRMVAAGTGASVAITLFAISEARFAAENFENAVVPRDLLVWNFDTKASNYTDLRKTALSLKGGAAWLTPFAAHGALLSNFQNAGFGSGLPYAIGSDSAGDSVSAATIAEAYIKRGVANDEAQSIGCLGELSKIEMSGSLVVNPCPFGKKADDPGCGQVTVDQIDSRTLTCGALDDMAVALRGLHPRDVWLTRLEAELPRSALASDLRLKPADQQLPIDNWIRITGSVGDPCTTVVSGVIGPDQPRRGTIVGLALLSLFTLVVARRASLGALSARASLRRGAKMRQPFERRRYG